MNKPLTLKQLRIAIPLLADKVDSSQGEGLALMRALNYMVSPLIRQNGPPRDPREILTKYGYKW